MNQDFQLPQIPEGKAYLGNADVVHGLLEELAQLVLQVHDEHSAGIRSREDAIEAIQEACRTMGAIFAGQDPDYHPADWHGPRLAGKIRASVPGITGGDAQSAIASYFEWVATQVTKVANEMDQGMADEQAGPAIQGGLQAASRFLLGVSQ